MPLRSLLCVFAVFCVFSLVQSLGDVVVKVDPVNGNDSVCFSAMEVNEPGLDSIPCRTINCALGAVAHYRNDTGQLRLSDVVISLANGLHRLTGDHT